MTLARKHVPGKKEGKHVQENMGLQTGKRPVETERMMAISKGESP